MGIFSADASAFDLLELNLPRQSQCRVQPHLDSAPPDRWQVTDLLGEPGNAVHFEEMTDSGLVLDLPAHSVRLWRISE